MHCLINPDACLVDLQQWLIGFVPDWLWFLLAVPVSVWWLVSVALAYVAGRWGLGGALAVVTFGVTAFIAARASMRQSEPAGEFGEMESDPHPIPRPVPQPRPRRTLRDIFRR